jgi:hypothetical protein
MDRRSFLTLAGAGVAGSLLSPSVGEAADPDEERRLLEQLARARRRWDRASSHTLARVRPDAAEVDESVSTWARGVGAMQAIEKLSRVKLEHQAHPSAQALLRELFESVGAALRSLRLGLRRTVDAPAPEVGPLDAILEGEERAFDAESGIGEASRRLFRNGLATLRAEIREEGLVVRMRRETRRLERLEDLAERIAAAGTATAVLAPADPEVRRALERGRARWSAVETPTEWPPRHLLILGLVGCGLGILAGGLVAVQVVSCALSCDAPGLLPLVGIGAIVIVLSLYGMYRLAQSLRADRTGPTSPPMPPAPDCPPCPCPNPESDVEGAL